MDNSMRNIIILSTGGTIEKTYDEFDGSLYNHDTIIKEKLQSRLRLPYTRIEVKTLMAKDSLDLTDKDRKSILASVTKFLEFNSPIIIMHGTDTMQVTAELLEKELKNLPVPVIFTGAMKPLGFEDSDATQNITEAIFAATFIDPGVYISFHNRLFTVPGVRKNRPMRTFEAF